MKRPLRAIAKIVAVSAVATVLPVAVAFGNSFSLQTGNIPSSTRTSTRSSTNAAVVSPLNSHIVDNEFFSDGGYQEQPGRGRSDSNTSSDNRKDTGTSQRPQSTKKNSRRHRSGGILLNRRRKNWTNRSLKYYTTVAREQKRRNRGQLPPSFPRSTPAELRRQISLAEQHYFARSLIKSGKLDHAESLYRRIIHEIQTDEDGCDHARLAVSTLLLALLKQRMNDVKGTRSVFLSFFRTTVMEYPNDKECACSAKVLQAYALFEMKRGHGRKSLEIVERAVELDEDLRPVLAWKQFREVMKSAADPAAGGTSS